MGGCGSGKQATYCCKHVAGESSPLATGHWPLATRKLARSGQLVPGRSFSWQWKVCDRQVAGIHVRVTVQALNLCCQKRWRIH